MFGITTRGMVHSGITVSDLDKSICFYRDLLGLEMLLREAKISTRAKYLGVPDAVVESAIFAIPESDATLELIKFHRPGQPNAYGSPVNAVGTVHIAFRVDDIESVIGKLTAAGVTFTADASCEISEGPLGGWRWLYFKDPDGTNLELVEGDR